MNSYYMDKIKQFGSDVAYFFRELRQQSYNLFFGMSSSLIFLWSEYKKR